MRAVMPVLLPEIANNRRQTGADRYDEMWDGVLHMPPMPNRFHQNLEWALETYLRLMWKPTPEWRVNHGINVAAPGSWPDNYRVPDVVLLSPRRFGIDRNEYFEGGPDVVVEIRSPGDETYEKLDFYAAVNVREVWVIHRDTGVPEIHVLRRGRYSKQRALADGWIRSRATGIELSAGKPGKLAIRLQGNERSRRDLPKG